MSTMVWYANEIGMAMRSLKDHTVLGYSIFRQTGGPEHQLLLLDRGQYFVELKLQMLAEVLKHVVVYDADFRLAEHVDGQGRRRVNLCGQIKDNDSTEPAKLLDSDDRVLAQPPPARAVFASLFPGATRVSIVNAWLCERKEEDEAPAAGRAAKKPKHEHAT